MGNGKGNPEYYVAEIQPGKVLYEMDGVSEELAREAFAWRPPSCRWPRPSSRVWWVDHESKRTQNQKRRRAEQGAAGPAEGQFSLRMQAATQQLSNTSQIGKVRRDIARVRTLLREKAVQQ